MTIVHLYNVSLSLDGWLTHNLVTSRCLELGLSRQLSSCGVQLLGTGLSCAYFPIALNL